MENYVYKEMPNNTTRLAKLHPHPHIERDKSQISDKETGFNTLNYFINCGYFAFITSFRKMDGMIHQEHLVPGLLAASL